jgi:pimeloyl-ACP methyl ester carboxylesterase
MAGNSGQDTLKVAAASAGAESAPPLAAMDARTFDSRRRFVDLPSGRIAYVEQGQGPVAVFLHGVPLNGFHWRHVMAGIGDMRRCIALDLMGLGYSEISVGQDVSMVAQARMLLQFLDALGVDRVDLVGNDTGGAIAQIFAVDHPHRLRSLTLTNCDVHDNYPGETLLQLMNAARQGTLAARYEGFLAAPDTARTRFAVAYADPGVLTDDVLRMYLEPVLANDRRKAAFHRYFLALDPVATVAIEPRLRALGVPTLVVWGTADAFFDVKWAHWLRDTIAGVVGVVEVPDAKLFFPEDRPRALIEPLRAFLASRK